MGHLKAARTRQFLTIAACMAALNTLAPVCDAADEPADNSEEDLATARLHFKNGVELLQSEPPNHQDAFRQFELAREKSGSWKVLGNLGLCALKLERDGEALEFYGEYLEKGGDEVDPAERKEIERELLLLRGNLTTVQIESTDPAARISVRRQGSHAPTQLYSLSDGQAELGLRSGSLVIVAQSGEKTLEWTPVLSAGETASHTFDFTDQAAEVPPPTTGTAAPAAATSEVSDEGGSGGGPSGLQIAGYATAGVGVALAGTGVVFGLLSQGKASDAEDACLTAADGTQVCTEATEGDFDSAQSQATLANIFMIGGGVLAATGITLVVVGGKSANTESASLQLSPAPTWGGGGLLASGHF